MNIKTITGCTGAQFKIKFKVRNCVKQYKNSEKII